MVVQIDARRFTSAAIPPEDEPPLFIDADRMEVFEMPFSFSKWLLGGTRKS
jgi:hypothetical protein